MRLPYVLSIVAGLTFALASGLTNILYAIAKSPEPAQQALWCSVAVAASAVVAVAPTALLCALRQKAYGGAVLAVVVLLLCGAYSLSGALGSAVGVRLSSEAQATDTESKRLRASEAYATAKRELEALTEAKGARALARKAELSSTMESATRELSTLGPSKPSNTDAVALATYLSLMGIEVEASDLNKWLALLAVLLIEFGGGLSFALASTVKPARQPTLALVPPAVGPTDEGRLLQAISDNGGSMVTSTRPLGKLLGVSHVTAGKLVRALETAGTISVRKDKNGTFLSLPRLGT